MNPLTLALALAALLPWTAQAVDYNQVQAGQSAIDFAYQQMGVAMDGKFRRFSAQLSFDPARPATARASIDVDLASIDTGLPDADEEAGGKQWFNIKAFPTARFVSSSVRALGGNRYELAGQLTIKGRTQAVVAPMTFTAQGQQGVFDGSFPIRRADFAIGEGAWAAFDTVANEIRIKFHVVATSGQ